MTKKNRAFRGSRPDPSIVSGGSQTLASGVGSGQEVFEVLRVGSGRVGFFFFHLAGRGGLPWLDLTRENT